MITPITATFPALNFPKEVDYPTQEDWAAFSAAAELNYGILSGEWSTKSQEFKAQTNNLALEIQQIGENAINAISLDTIEDLATYTGTGLVMVKDISRGGTFVSKTVVEIDPNTGSLYSINGGTVFAKLGGGFWARQYTDKMNVKWFNAKGDWNGTTGTDDTLAIQKAIDAVSVSIFNELEFEKNKTYLVGKLVPKNYVYINLNNCTLRLKNNANTPLFFDNGTSTPKTNFKVMNGILDCNQAYNNGLNVLGGIWLTNWSNITFHNLLIKNCSGIGINPVGCSYIDIKDYKFEDSGVVGSPYYAYALTIVKDVYESNFITLNNIQVSNVIGYGIHLYGCSYVSGSNFSFYNLNYSNTSIAITFTGTSKCNLSNIYTNIISGDAIEINETDDTILKNIKVVSSGNRALLIGYNTNNTIYNNKLVIENFEDLNTQGTSSCVLSYCNNSIFRNFKTSKAVISGTLATGTKNNSLSNFDIRTTLSSCATLINSERYVIDNLICTDYTVISANINKINLSKKYSFAVGEVKSINLYDVFYSEMSTDAIIMGEAKIANIFPSSYSQNSFQTFNFNANNLGTAVNLSTVTTLNGVIGRSLTIAGDAANKSITLTNNSGVALNSYVTFEAYKIGG